MKAIIHRDKQIQLAKHHYKAMEAVRASLSLVLEAIKIDAGIIKFDDDIGSGLWNIVDNAFHLPKDISDALHDSEISTLKTWDDQANAEKEREELRAEHIAYANASTLSNQQMGLS